MPNRDVDIGFPTASGMTHTNIQTIASPITLTAAIQYLYEWTSNKPFYFGGTFLSWDSGTWALSEEVTVTVDLKVDETNWENLWTETYTAANAPLTVSVPNIVDANLRRMPQGFWVDATGIRVGIVQGVVGAGYHVISHISVHGIQEGGT